MSCVCYKKTRKIFKALGRLRNLQHNDRYIKKSQLPAASQKVYDSFYAIKKHRVSKRTHKALNHFKLDSFNKLVNKVQKLSWSLTDEEISIKAGEFVFDKMKKADALLILKNSENHRKIHAIRKLLKLLQYTLNSILNFSFTRKDIVTKLKEMETYLGTWHDKFVLIQFIRKLMEENQKLKPASMEPFYLMEERLSIENRDKLIFQNIKHVFSQAKRTIGIKIAKGQG
jgi:CHAD domain-containing protein